MTSLTANHRPNSLSISRTILQGAGLGFTLAIAYGMTCSILFVVRSSIQAAPGLDADMALATLLASGLSILTAGIVFSALMGLFGALLGSICLTLARRVSRVANPGGRPQRNAWIGAGVTTVLTAALNLAFVSLTGPYFAALWPFGWLFWIGLPSLLLIIAIARLA